MAEVTENGYQSLRDFIEANWVYHSLEDDAGDEIIRISPSDSRTSWTHTAGDQVLELTTTVSGGDSDISVPQKFAGSSIFDVGTAGSPYASETFEAFTVETTSDELTVKHRIEVPQVV